MFNEYSEASFDELSTLSNFDKNIIPVGEIAFVTKALEKLGYNKENIMKPIEIPDILLDKQNKDKISFINREYHIVTYNEALELFDRETNWKAKKWFVKCATVLKSMDAHPMFKKEFISRAKLIDNYEQQLYVMSEPVNIIAEYRVLVCNDTYVDNVEYIGYYNGKDRLAFPDSNTIRTMINKIQYARDILKQKLPKSYTLDIAVHTNYDDSKYKTSIIEMHNFVSYGTYGYDGNSLLRMYRLGIEFEKSM